MKKNKKELATRAELEKLSDQELKAITLERDEKKRFTKRANIAYEVQRERHHAQACIGSTDFYVNKTGADTNWSMDSVYNGGYTE
jgi:hypothetical protein